MPKGTQSVRGRTGARLGLRGLLQKRRFLWQCLAVGQSPSQGLLASHHAESHSRTWRGLGRQRFRAGGTASAGFGEGAGLQSPEQEQGWT